MVGDHDPEGADGHQNILVRGASALGRGEPPVQHAVHALGDGSLCFKHDQTAIIVVELTLFIAFVCLQSFQQRNLKGRLRRLTLIGLSWEIAVSLERRAAAARAHRPRGEPDAPGRDAAAHDEPIRGPP